MADIRAAAAAMVEWDGRLLLVRRNPALRFMGGQHAFPGGRLDDGDRAFARERFGRDDDEAVGIAAAPREVFEETGLLLAEGPQPGEAARLEARAALLAGTTSFGAVLDAFGLRVIPERFSAAGYWVTPAYSPIRFSTRFYLYRYEGPYEGACCGGEIVGLDWLRPAEARGLWRRGVIVLPVPVAYALDCFSRFEGADAIAALRDLRGREAGAAIRFEVRCGVALLPLRTATLPPATETNAVLVGERELVLIDPGPSDAVELEVLDQQLGYALSGGGRLRAVLLTHGHGDHCGAAAYVSARYGAPVWAHAAAGVAADRAIGDGEIIELAGAPPWRLRAIHTPGHHPGHLAFLEESTGTLIAGDMVANPGSIVIAPSHGGDMTAYLASLDRLLAEEFAVAAPGHGLPMADGRERLAALKSHRLAREAAVLAAWDGGLRDLEGLLGAVYGGTAPEAAPLAQESLRAHLIRLGLEAK